MESPIHVLAESSTLEELNVPLSRSARLRYTCLSVSKKHIALGSNTGGVYIFTRDAIKYQQVIFSDVESASIGIVSLSPATENHVAFATSGGQVVVMEMNFEKRVKPERVRLTNDHAGCIITTLKWNAAGNKLFAGDNIGKVTVIHVPLSKASVLFNQPSEVIARLETSVVQMDYMDEKLLVSTMSVCYLFSTIRHQYSQIGKKLRDGDFGACFFVEPSSNIPVVYCSRPGSRMWEVDFKGNVLNTHQFKKLLVLPSTPVIDYSKTNLETKFTSATPVNQSVNFKKMYTVGEYIVTWCSTGLYVFDTINVQVILWCYDIQDIQDICVSENNLFIFNFDQTITHYQLLKLDSCLSQLLHNKQWLLSANTVHYFKQINVKTITNYISQRAIQNILHHLKTETDKTLIDSLSELVDLSVTLPRPDPEGQDEQSDHSDQAMSRSQTGSLTSLDAMQNITNDSESEAMSLFVNQELNRGTSQVDLHNQKITQKFVENDGKWASESKLETDGHKQMVKSAVLNNMSSANEIKKLPGTKSAEHIVSSNAEPKTTKITDKMSIGGETDSTKDKKKVERASQQVSVNDKGLISRSPSVAIETDSTKIKTRKERASEQVSVIESRSRHSSGYESRTFPSVNTQLSTLSNVSSDSLPVFEDASMELSPGVIETDGQQKDVAAVVPDVKMTTVSTSVGRKNSNRRRKVNEIDLTRPQTAGVFKSESFKSKNKKKNNEIKTKTKRSVSVPAISPEIMQKMTEKERDTISLSSFDGVLDDPSKDTFSELPNNESSVSLNSLEESVEEKPEIVLTLIQRLSASGINPNIDDLVNQNNKESPPTGSSGLESPVGGLSQSPRVSLMAVKDSLALKLKKGKSLIKQIKDKGNQLAKSPSLSEISLHDTIASSESNEDLSPLQEKIVEAKNDKVIENLIKVEPKTDLSKLEKITRETQNKLKDINIVLNPVLLKQVLNSWVLVLNTTLQCLHSEEFAAKNKEMETKMMQSLENQNTNVNFSKIFNKEIKTVKQSENQTKTVDNSKSMEKEKSEFNEKMENRTDSNSVNSESKLLTENTISSSKATLSENNSPEIEGTKTQDAGLENKNLETKVFENKISDTSEPSEVSALKVNGNRETLPSEICASGADLTSQHSNSKVTDTGNMLMSSNSATKVTETKNLSFNVSASKVDHTFDPLDYQTRCYVTDPFGLDDDLFSQVSELTKLCFQIGSHGNICDYILPQLSQKSSDCDTNDHVNNCETTNNRDQRVNEQISCDNMCNINDNNSIVAANLKENNQALNHDNDISSRLFSEDIDKNGKNTENLLKKNETLINERFKTNQDVSDDKIEIVSNVNMNGVFDSHEIKQINANEEILDQKQNHKNLEHKKLDYNFEKNNFVNKNNVGVMNSSNSAEINIASANVTADRTDKTQETKLEFDTQMSQFVRCFYSYIGIKVIRQVLWQREDVMFQTWLALVHCCQELGKDDPIVALLQKPDSNDAMDHLRSGILKHKHALLGHFFSLFGISAYKCVEFSLEVVDEISPLDILNLCRYHNKPTAQFFLKYIMLRYNSSPEYSRLKTLRLLCEHREVKLELLRCLLVRKDDVVCNNIPSRGSHLIKWSHHVMINHLLSFLATPEEQTTAEYICKQHGYWLGYLKLLDRNTRWKEILKLIYLLGDIQLLSITHSYGYTPKTREEWKYLFDEFMTGSNNQSPSSITDDQSPSSITDDQSPSSITDDQLPSSITDDQSPSNIIDDQSASIPEDCSFTLENLMFILIDNLGPHSAISMFDEISLDSANLSNIFYQKCVFKTITQQQQGQVIHNMLEKINTYLWSKKPYHMAPQLHHAVSSEKSSQNAPTDSNADITSYQANFSRLSSSLTVHPGLEDVECHWAVQADINSECISCGQYLTVTVSHMVPGAVIFQCGHTFHKFCVSKLECPLC